MSKEVTKLTTQSEENEAIHLEKEDLETPDLSGEHSGRVIFLERKTSQQGNDYFSVGIQIDGGHSEGEAVFGRIFPGRPMRRFLQCAGLATAGLSELSKDDVIGKTVRFLVGTEEVEVFGSMEQQYVISKFLRQPTSGEAAKELF